MNTSRNVHVLEMHKCLRIIERDLFFNQLSIMVSRKVEIQNAVCKMKDVTELGKNLFLAHLKPSFRYRKYVHVNISNVKF